MTKSQRIAMVASSTRHISKRDSGTVVDAIFGSMAEALVRGERIAIWGFGSFRVRVREAEWFGHDEHHQAFPGPEP